MKRLAFFLLLFISISCYPQGEHNNWYFGWYGALTFNSGNPVVLPQPAFFGRSHVHYPAVSDSLGNLLWTLSNGAVYNRNLNIMPNGQNILDGPMGPSQNIGILQPGSNHIYYLFTVSNENYGNTAGLRYSVIDMELNGGMGDIVAGMKNLTLPYGDSCDAQLSATRHHNNKDVWFVAVRHGKPNVYLSYLLTASGLNTNPVISSSMLTKNYHNSEITYFRGYLKISRDGNHISRSDSLMELSWFNDLNGIVTPRFIYHVNDAGTYQGSEFSKEAKYLYVSPTQSNAPSPFFRLYQYDMASPDSLSFVQSKTYIGDSAVSNLQIAPDGKIYLGYNYVSSEYMSVINYPSLPGASCGYTKKVIHFGEFRQHENGASDFIETYKLFIFNEDKCESDSVHFTSYIWPAADSIRWDFGDPASGGSNYSTLPSPSHFYGSAGSYLVRLYVRHDDNRSDTVWKTVNIIAYPTPELGDDRTICTGDSVTFDAGVCNGCTYQWKNLFSGLIVGSNQTYTTGTAGDYCVNVTNTNGCTGSDSVQLITTTTPLVTNNPPLAKTICSGESTNILLTGNVPGVMFHWTATLNSGTISGFSADSGQVINQILINNGSTAGLVTYHITPKIGDCTGTPVDYAITVNVGDPVDVTITASINTVCAGTMVTFTANPVNPGINPAYQWKVNGVNAGSNAHTFANVPANGDIVTCILTSSNVVCTSNNPATSNSITMVVNPLQSVSVVVTPSANPVCFGSSVNFTATPGNGGIIPQYQWKVNGLIVGTNSQNYSYVPVNGDAITCTLTSNVLCPSGNPAISNTVTMSVKPILPVGVSIVASSNPFCLGSAITFTATPVNGGLVPGFQWKVNGINAGTNNPVFVYSPANNDVITCSLLSSETCISGNPAQSNSITMVVNANLPAGITISASSNPFCPGSAVTFTATPVNGGSNPSYQWKVNGINAGTNSSGFSYVPVNNDSVQCVINSNLSCVTGNPASSAKIIMIGSLAPNVAFPACFDTVTLVNAKPFKLKGGLPLGGNYSGPGVNSSTGIFTPSVAGIGVKTINYSYVNVYDCSASKSKSILVQPAQVFSCGSNLTDTRDNKVYLTVQIGTQCWLASNLNYGNTISSSLVQYDNCISEKYCYNNLAVNCNQYGGLYQWDELMNYTDTPLGQGLCPPGWHVPSESDWTILFNYYQGNSRAGRPLQDTIINGFKALRSGVLYLNSSISFLDFATLFWSSTSSGQSKSLSHGMNSYNFSASFYQSSRSNAFPVRCLKD